MQHIAYAFLVDLIVAGRPLIIKKLNSKVGVFAHRGAFVLQICDRERRKILMSEWQYMSVFLFHKAKITTRKAIHIWQNRINFAAANAKPTR